MTETLTDRERDEWMLKQLNEMFENPSWFDILFPLWLIVGIGVAVAVMFGLMKLLLWVL